MARRRIWELNCFGIDAVLCTSFDPDELLSLDAGLRCNIPERPGIVVPTPLIIYGVAHKACHTENPVSRKIERRLDCLHERILRECAGMDEIDTLVKGYQASEEAGEDLAGCLWSILTDPRAELRQQGLFWVQGLMIRSLQHWMRSWKLSREKGLGERQGRDPVGNKGR